MRSYCLVTGVVIAIAIAGTGRKRERWGEDRSCWDR